MEEIRTGSAPVGLTVHPSHDRVYVTNRGAGSVSVLGVADGVEWSQIPVGGGPGGVVVDPHDGRILVANAGSQTMSIVEDLLAGRPPAPVVEEPSPWIGKQAAGLLARGLPDAASGARTTTGPRRSTSSTSSPAGEGRATRRRRSSRNCGSRGGPVGPRGRARRHLGGDGAAARGRALLRDVGHQGADPARPRR